MAIQDNPTQPADQGYRKLREQYDSTRQGYDAAKARVDMLSNQVGQLSQKVNPTVVPSEGRYRPNIETSATPGGMTALTDVRRQLASAQQNLGSYAKPMTDMAGQFRAYTDRTNARKLIGAVGGQMTPAAAGADVSSPVQQAGNSPVPSATSVRPHAADAPASTTPPAATTAQPAPPTDGIYRGRDAKGNGVYSDSAAGLAQSTADANRGFGSGTPESRKWLASVPALASDGTGSIADAAVPRPRRTTTFAAPAAASATAPGTGAAQPASTPTAMPTPSAAAATQNAVSISSPASGGAFTLPPRSLPQVSAGDRPASFGPVGGAQGAVIANPNAPGIVDQLRSLSGDPAFARNRTLRGAAAQALMQQAGYQNAGEQAALNRDQQAALNAQNLNANAQEGFARRQLEASQTNAGLANSDAGRQLEARSLRTTVRGADGGTYGLSNDGSLRRINNPDGSAFSAAPDTKQELSPDAKLKSLDDRYKAITEAIGPGGKATPEQQQDLNSIEAMRSQLFGGASQRPSFNQFKAAATSAGSSMSDDQLRAAFNERYGS